MSKKEEEECYFCGEYNKNGLVEVYGIDVYLCEQCDCDGSNYNGWMDEEEVTETIDNSKKS